MGFHFVVLTFLEFKSERFFIAHPLQVGIQFEKVKITLVGVLLLVELHVEASDFIKSNTPPWKFFMFFIKTRKASLIISNFSNSCSDVWREILCCDVFLLFTKRKLSKIVWNILFHLKCSSRCQVIQIYLFFS